MATAAELEQYRTAVQTLVTEAKRDLLQLWMSLQGNPPETVRDVLLEYLPVLTEQYGTAAAALAAEWFESLPTGGWATLAPPVPAPVVEGALRREAGKLWTPSPDAAIAALQQDLTEWVQRPGRHTVQKSAITLDMGWVRVPQGAKTCAFCLMLASRSVGWLYRSKETALHRKRDGEKFHPDCDCQIVPARGEDDIPWDPDPAFRVYRAATDLAGTTSDTAEILATIRRIAPDAVTDGVRTS